MVDTKKTEKKDKPRGEKSEGAVQPSKILKRKPKWDRKGKPEQENR